MKAAIWVSLCAVPCLVFGQTMSIEEYQPKSTLVVPETRVERFRFRFFGPPSVYGIGHGDEGGFFYAQGRINAFQFARTRTEVTQKIGLLHQGSRSLVSQVIIKKERGIEFC